MFIQISGAGASSILSGRPSLRSGACELKGPHSSRSESGPEVGSSLPASSLSRSPPVRVSDSPHSLLISLHDGSLAPRSLLVLHPQSLASFPKYGSVRRSYWSSSPRQRRFLLSLNSQCVIMSCNTYVPLHVETVGEGKINGGKSFAPRQQSKIFPETLEVTWRDIHTTLWGETCSARIKVLWEWLRRRPQSFTPNQKLHEMGRPESQCGWNELWPGTSP